MSWLSDLFGGGNDDVAVEQARQAAEDRRTAEARAREDQLRTEQVAKNAAFRTNATNAGRTSALSYFGNLGLNPDEFAGDIDTEIAKILGTTAEDDPNVGAYLGNLGESVYGTRETGLRNKSGRDIDMLFQPEFERTRIADTADDDILSQINTAERGEADEFLNNLQRRGVITATGRAGAGRNLDDQGARVRGILDEIGRTALSGGRSGLTDIANRGRQTAQTLKLGQSFDAGTYGSQANASLDDFLSGLGDRIRGQITDPLYDTSGLAAIAGAAQGAGNTKFDPKALAGINVDDEDDEDDQNRNRRVSF